MFTILQASGQSPENSMLLAEIGAALLVLGIVAFIANKLKFSVVPLYLLIGLAIGEGGVVPLSLSEEFLNTGAQIGAIMLLLLLGLEYSAYDLAKAFQDRKSAGLIDFVANATPGFVLGWLLGWGLGGALALAGITYVSSSGIAAQLIKEMGWRRSEVSKRAIGVLVFEDLALAPYLPLLTSIVLGVSAVSGIISVSLALAITGLVILVSFRGTAKWSKILDPNEPGGLLLTVFGAALLAAGLADLVGFSGVVAAFLIGLLLTGEVAETARARLSPIRDIFSAIFFLFFGITTDPADLPAVFPLALLLTALGIAGKYLVGWWVTRDLSDPMSAWRATGFLIARGEFSMVIAALAAPIVLGIQLQALTLAYVIMTAFAASVVLRFSRSQLDRR
ncbi:cation:proton antiporter [Aquiluna sp. KACHI24]|uniref:cation:proton antiporter n=1 Tax=Aquiluna sp. KACHI24 TaxID=2968831 RepID=UPI0022019DE6|nr:cation:proton antiporter [Aquiluna sp. KACHI24]BDQ00448.1 potassium transporter [Aquiluna sp. KACHI24]